MNRRPLEITLDLARCEEAEDPFAFQFAAQRYLIRHGDGRIKTAPFSWGAQIRADLRELSTPHPTSNAVQRLGVTLRHFLADLDWGRLEDQLIQAHDGGGEIHLRCRFAAAELYSLPWELLTLESTGQHLCELPRCFIYYEWPGACAPLRPRPPIAGGRVLLAYSAAGGIIPVEQHFHALQKACAGSEYRFDPARDVIAHVSLDSLARAFRDSPEPIVALHVLCHGARGSGPNGLIWNSSRPGGEPEAVDGGALRRILARYATSLRLVILCACQGGSEERFGQHLGSVAQELHRSGVPAVVASRFPMSTEGSVRLTASLYQELLPARSSLSQALARTRNELFTVNPSLDWAALQLYLRSGDLPDLRLLVPRRATAEPGAGSRRWWVVAGALVSCATMTTLAISAVRYLKPVGPRLPPIQMGQEEEKQEAVLAARPDDLQALLARAQLLDKLGLKLLSADPFEGMAPERADGLWSSLRRWYARRRFEGMAPERADWLRRDIDRQRKDWNDCNKNGETLAHHTDDDHTLPALLEAVDLRPGLVRLWFYEAVRTATSLEQIRMLYPLAAKLDHQTAATVLTDHLQRVQATDFTLRAPLARRYLELLRGHAIEDLPAFIRRLRDSQQDDIFVGVLLRAPSVSLSLDEFDQLLFRFKDPWVRLLLEEKRAERQQKEGQLEAASQRLSELVKGCDEISLAYRCMTLRRGLTAIYLETYHVNKAHEHALKGLALARQRHEWAQERGFLEELARIARFRGQAALARAYLTEALLRGPSSCDERRFLDEMLAQVALYGSLDFHEAREQLEQVLRRTPECSELSLQGLTVLGDLGPPARKVGDVDILKKGLRKYTSASKPLDVRLRAKVVEGNLEIERDPPAGRALLWEVIQEANAARSSSVGIAEARDNSFSSLIFDATERGAYDQSLKLMAEKIGIAAPSRCALVVAVRNEQTAVVMVNHQGRLFGQYDRNRTVPLKDDLSGLVPAFMSQALVGCDQVDVLADPVVQAGVRLLPRELAWRYRMARPLALSSAQGAEKHVVVANVEPPEEFELQKLQTWHARADDEYRIVLGGAMATLSRVLREMQDATEIAFYTHGLNNPLISDASFIVLSPEHVNGERRSALTATDVLRAPPLLGAPLVMLVACEAASPSAQKYKPLSLPAAFIKQGAQSVLASTQSLPDGPTADFFEAIRDRIRAGAQPAIAARDERLKHKGGDWTDSIIVFE